MGLSAALLGMAACQDAGGGDADKAASCGGKIAIFGAFTGPNAGLVLPSLNGAKLAFKQFNAANPDCKATLQEFDTQGNAEQATPIANQVAQDTVLRGCHRWSLLRRVEGHDGHLRGCRPRHGQPVGHRRGAHHAW